MESFVPPPHPAPGTALHTQLLQSALAQAASADAVADAPETRLRRGLNDCVRACLCSPPLALAVTGLLALSLLLVIRPPFILRFEHDARRPWKGAVSVSWFGVLVTLVLTLLVAAGLPLFLAAAGE